MALIEATERFIKSFNKEEQKLRFHISNSPNLSKELNFTFASEKQKWVQKAGKPCGLWWGVGDSWMDFCVTDCGCVRPFVYEIKINEESLLKINTCEQIDSFTREYIISPEFDFFPKFDFDFNIMSEKLIDWYKVGERYQAIEITPYFWERRLKFRWYYGWDCASGCVWVEEPISSIKLFAYYDEKTDEIIRVDRK
jgi:hypothetical protein